MVSIKGFSSLRKTETISDLVLAKVDLYNHFNTRKGERVMRPEFGCSIWDLIGEPLNDYAKDLIQHEVKSIINNDPRFSLVELNLTTLTRGFNLDVTVNYIPLNTIDTITITYI